MKWPASLQIFDGHSLEDQSAVALMDRVDTKFLVPRALLGRCLGGLSEHYTVLESAGRRQMAYDTFYFDTPDRKHYREHHNGKLNRLKVRIRCYRDTGQAFLEIKRKNNKGRTVKERRGLDADLTQPIALEGLAGNLLGLPATGMSPALFVQYHRSTLMSRSGCERVTVDTDLGFLSPVSGRRATLSGLAVMELKSGSPNIDSPLRLRLKALGYRPVAFSKYCIGTALLEPGQVKTNRFKPVLTLLDGMVSHFKESSWSRPSIPTSSFG